MVMSRPAAGATDELSLLAGQLFPKTLLQEAALLGAAGGDRRPGRGGKDSGGDRGMCKAAGPGPATPGASQCPRPSHRAPGLEPKNHRRAARSWEGRQRKAWPVSLLLCLRRLSLPLDVPFVTPITHEMNLNSV